MSFNGLTFPSGATYAPTGGTTKTLGLIRASGDSATYFVEEDPDLKTRREVVITAKAPKVSASAPGGYTQARSTMLFKSPMTLANGEVTVNTVRIEVSYDPELSEADKATLRQDAAQFLFDTEAESLWDQLSVG